MVQTSTRRWKLLCLSFERRRVSFRLHTTIHTLGYTVHVWVVHNVIWEILNVCFSAAECHSTGCTAERLELGTAVSPESAGLDAELRTFKCFFWAHRQHCPLSRCDSSTTEYVRRKCIRVNRFEEKKNLKAKTVWFHQSRFGVKLVCSSNEPKLSALVLNFVLPCVLYVKTEIWHAHSLVQGTFKCIFKAALNIQVLDLKHYDKTSNCCAEYCDDARFTMSKQMLQYGVLMSFCFSVKLPWWQTQLHCIAANWH